MASPSGVESVRFPVWEASDQDGTIHWYDADRQPDGSYRAVVSISNHQYRMGTYRAHVYVTCGNGVEYNTNAGDNEVAAARTSIEIGDKAGTQRTYHYSARNLGILGAKGVSVAVWGAQDGQNDLRWYTAKQGASGAWEADISIRNHREAGEYYADTYITLMNGSQMCVQTKKFSVSYPTVQTTIGTYDADSGTFELVAHDIASPSGVESVRFPVWYKNNQENTIYWYDAEKQADGTFKAIVNVRNHNYCVGSYQIHTYLTCGNGVEYNTNAGEIHIDNVVIRELYPIMGTPAVSVSQMISYFKQKMQPYPSDALRKGGASTIKEFCQIVYDESIAEGVKPEVVFAQAMLETGYLQFGHDVKIEQFNFCGMGATGGVPGNSFPDIRTGIRAQVQHLKCYATDKPLNNSNVDPRWWSELRNKAPYVEWLSIPNNPFGRGWAADPGYGVKLLNMISDIKKQ
ncbi:MAG: GBS Bsp-like repeat-containing protein [[Clostridium] scindens]